MGMADLYQDQGKKITTPRPFGYRGVATPRCPKYRGVATVSKVPTGSLLKVQSLYEKAKKKWPMDISNGTRMN